VDEVKLNKDSKRRFDVVVLVALWMFWKFRNEMIFGKEKSRKAEIFDDIRYFSYFWITYRSRKKFSWDCWLLSPFML